MNSDIYDLINNYEVIFQETNKHNLLLIDGDIILYSICFNKKQTEEDIKLYGNQEERTFEDIKNQLNSYLVDILKVTNCVYFKGFLTSGSFRYRIAKSSDYKGNRKSEKPNYFYEAREYLKEQWDFFDDPNQMYEADDLIASWKEYYKDFNTIIASIDKDLDQIEGNHYNFRKKEFYSISKNQAVYKLWSQIITGDSTDNIKGLEGKGIKYAEKLLGSITEHLYPQSVLDAYITQYGLKNGINKYYENFNLIYLDNNYNKDIIEKVGYSFIKNIKVNNIN
jgi:5'-3' exonuclease